MAVERADEIVRFPIWFIFGGVNNVCSCGFGSVRVWEAKMDKDFFFEEL